MTHEFITSIEKGIPQQLRIEFNKETLEKVTLLKSGQVKDYRNLDVTIILFYFNAMGFDLIETLRMLFFLVAQKYPVQNFESVLQDLVEKKMPSMQNINPTKPIDIYAEWMNKHQKSGQNYLSFASYFFDQFKQNFEGKMDSDDLVALETLFSTPMEHQIDVLEKEIEEHSLMQEMGSKTLESVDVGILSRLVDSFPLAVLASQSNNLHRQSNALDLRSKNLSKDVISEKARGKEDRIAFIELGVLTYVGYTPQVKERIQKRIESPQFVGEIEMVFLNK